MANTRENHDVSASGEDKVNAMRGYKATISNPNVSQEAKANAQGILDNELHGNESQQELYAVRDRNVDPVRVAGGFKAAQHNPRNYESGKRSVTEKLRNMPEGAGE